MEGKLPLKSDLEWSRSGDFYVLLDKATGKASQLDAISFLVWIQCDGRTPVSNIVDVFAVGGNRDIIETAVTGVLEKLTGGGLVKWA